MTFKTHGSIALGLVLVLVFAGISILKPKLPVSHVVVLGDRSDSPAGGCQCIKAIGKRVIESPVHFGSKLTFFVTGDKNSDNKPILLKEFDIPRSNKVLDGKGKVAQERQKALDELLSQCQSQSLTKTSPIFIGVKLGVEHLRSLGCDEKSSCALYVQTDGEETVDDLVRKAIKSVKNQMVLPPPIQNAGIKIAFVGLAQTNGTLAGAARNRSARDIDRIQQVWKALFSNPENVLFEPYCTGSDKQF